MFRVSATLDMSGTRLVGRSPALAGVRPVRTARSTGQIRRRSATVVNANMSDPNQLFPEKPWGWDKAPPKQSLKELPQPQDATATAWKLNLIEAIHWASFPSGFYILHYIFVNAPKIGTFVGGDQTRVFLLLLGLSCQVFGGGISGNMMHEYEGWQVAPFRNPLALPPSPAEPSDVDQLRIPRYNNAWLRSVAYQMLFTFQTVGLGCFSMGAFGVNPATLALVLGSVSIALLGPRTPRPLFQVNAQPVLPISWSLLVVFAVNVLVNLLGYHALFGPAIAQAWPPAALPWLAGVPKWLVEWLPLAAPLAVAAGGAIEGAVAESTFNQWWHFVAFVILTLGLGLHGVLYWQLVNLA